MSRIQLDPAGMRTSGLQFVAACDVVNGVAGAIGALELPLMPADMTERHRADLAAIAQRLKVCAQSSATLGEELQLRAAAAEAADAPSAGTEVDAGGRVLEIVSVTVVGAGGVQITAELKISGKGVKVKSSTGLRFTMPELAGRRPPAGETDSAESPIPEAERPGDDPQPAPETARPLDSQAPVGGPVGAAVHEAVAAVPSEAVAPGADLPYVNGDPLHPSSGAGLPDLRAGDHDGAGAPPPKEMPATETANRQEWGCWMAGAASGEGLPPALPLMIALSSGGLRNVPDGTGGGVGFFSTEAGSAFAPAGHGLPRGVQPEGDWWVQNPGAQLDHLVRGLRDTGGGIRTQELTDADAMARWAHDALPGVDPQELAATHEVAEELVARCRGGEGAVSGTGSVSGGSGALKAAASQIGVREMGANSGPQVNAYLASANVGSGNPWCAGFVTWSMQQAGIDMPGGGWAAVQTWVHAAEAGDHGLQIVSAADARPGDIVAYDWGGGADFGADAHIGLLESDVSGGRFTAVEGNTSDAVARIERNVSTGNVVFIRAGG